MMTYISKIHEWEAEKLYKEAVDLSYDGMDLSIVIDWMIEFGWDTQIDDKEVLWFIKITQN